MPMRNIVRRFVELHNRAYTPTPADADEIILRLEQNNARLRAENLGLIKTLVELTKEVKALSKPKYKMGGCIKDWQQETEV